MKTFTLFWNSQLIHCNHFSCTLYTQCTHANYTLFLQPWKRLPHTLHPWECKGSKCLNNSGWREEEPEERSLPSSLLFEFAHRLRNFNLQVKHQRGNIQQQQQYSFWPATIIFPLQSDIQTQTNEPTNRPALENQAIDKEPCNGYFNSDLHYSSERRELKQ